MTAPTSAARPIALDASLRPSAPARAPGSLRILLVSTYELGHQPLGLAAPAAALRRAGHAVRTLDLAVESPERERFADLDLVAISVPMHTAARVGIDLATRLRARGLPLRVAFYGLYASPLHARLMRDGLADAVIGGEYEPGLVAYAAQVATEARPTDESAAPGAPRGALTGVGAEPAFARQDYPVPDRRGLPPLADYARLADGAARRLVGYVEATRGCAHRCTHCPLTPVYGGRLRLVSPETVLADIDQLVAAGAEHITFGDPDFLNAAPHALALAEALHARHPGVTFDATIKVEHLLEHVGLLPRLRALGCLFVTSAFESTNDATLAILEKGHTRADMEHALALADAAGITVRPTWVAHMPWTTPADFLDMLAFIEQRGLVAHVQPVQYAIRLLLPPGSPLIDRLAREGRLGPFDDETLTYTWTASDPRLDALQRELATIVESAACGDCDDAEPPLATFRRVKAAAYRHLLDDERSVDVVLQPRAEVPGLTEAWFCCAEPTEAQLAPLDRALGI
ncbi:MAG: CUAEP/CCAEP-tail radical SAM protein [Dehalococcoidia bacterium]